MNETQVLEGFWQSVGHAPWPVVLGYALVGICIGLKGLTEGKLHGSVKAWFGAITGMLIGVGSAMALEGDWIHGVVFGVLVGGSSTGFWSLVKATIPDIGKPSKPPPALIVGGLLLLVTMAGGCGAENRCLAERSTVAALGIAAGMASSLVPDTDEGHQAMAIAEASIDAGGAIVAACEQIRDDARDWRGWLDVAVAAVKAVLAIIAAAGVDIPQAVSDQIGRLEELVAPPIARAEAYL